MTVTTNDLVQVGGQIITLATVVFTYLATRGKVTRVHDLVNNASDAQVTRIDQLTQSLQGAGGIIPPAPGKTAP